MTPTKTTQMLLLEAREAYHALNTGTLARVFVDQNGERVEYNSTNRQALANYIRELEQIASGRPLAGGPARFIF